MKSIAALILLAVTLPAQAADWQQLEMPPAPTIAGWDQLEPEARQPVVTPEPAPVATPEQAPHPDAGQRWLVAVGQGPAEKDRLRDLAEAHGFRFKASRPLEDLPIGVYQCKLKENGKLVCIVDEFDDTPPPKPKPADTRPNPPPGYRWQCGENGCYLVPINQAAPIRQPVPVVHATYRQSQPQAPAAIDYQPAAQYAPPVTYYQPAPTYYAPPAASFTTTRGSCATGNCGGSESYAAGPSDFYGGFFEGAGSGGACGPGGCGSGGASQGGGLFGGPGLFGGFFRGGCRTCR